MRKSYPAFLLVIITLLAINCQKEIKSVEGGANQPPTNNPGTSTPAPLTATLQGNVVDENDEPAIGVVIKVGSKSATTNARGYFRIGDAALDKEASFVTAEKTGYFKLYRSFCATTGVNQVLLKLAKKTLGGTVGAATGGNITLSNGTNIALPANGFVKGSAAYTGNVTVYASYIDPTSADIGQTIPGSFMARDKDDKRVTLSSYGMLAVDLETSSGEKLQLASNASATLTIPVPSSIQSSAPATIPLWYLDEQSGIWKEDGTATKNGTNYVGQVKHFTYWNADVNVPTVGFSATFVNSQGQPFTYLNVRVKAAAGYVGYAYGVTDSLGQVSGYIPANMPLILEVMNACNGVAYTQNIGPYSSSINLGTITISNTVSIITITGKIVNCNNAPVTNGNALINFDNIVRNVPVNSAGEFSVSITTCSGTPPTCEIIPTDATAQQQGAAQNIMITPPVTNAGTLTACGTSTLQYINYNLDGVNYTISSASADSLLAYTSLPGVTLPMRMRMMGSHPPGGYLDLDFDCQAAAGVYSLINRLDVKDYRRTKVVNPFDITFTSFAQSVGGYHEGSFNGQFRDSSDLAPLHNLNGSFRIMKNW